MPRGKRKPNGEKALVQRKEGKVIRSIDERFGYVAAKRTTKAFARILVEKKYGKQIRET